MARRSTCSSITVKSCNWSVCVRASGARKASGAASAPIRVDAAETELVPGRPPLYRGPTMGDTSVTKVQAKHAPHGKLGQKYLASGVHVAMRLWEKEQP